MPDFDKESTLDALSAIVARAKSDPNYISDESVTYSTFDGEVPKPEFSEEDAICETCNQPFRAKVCQMGAFRIPLRNCEPCVQQWKRENEETPDAITDARKAAWEAICPEEYRETDRKRVEREVGAEILQKVTAWDISKGLAIIGKTGRCKTRLMFMLFGQHVMAGKKLRYINAVTLGDELAAQYGHGADQAERWMKEIQRAPYLFVDDLGKEKLTERIETFYYRLVEHRTAHRLPMFFTSNLNTSALEKRWELAARDGGFWSDQSAATCRRLRGACKGIEIPDAKELPQGHPNARRRE